MDARKEKLGREEALRILDEVDEIHSSRGRKVVHIDLRKEKLEAPDLKGLLLGPTGKLRAPSLRVDRTLVVGFDRKTYERLSTS